MPKTVENAYECAHNEYIKCPYCDFVREDSWEFGETDGTTYCDECGEEIHVTVHVTVEYSTYRTDELENHNG